jgi:hypothetical protein
MDYYERGEDEWDDLIQQDVNEPYDDEDDYYQEPMDYLSEEDEETKKNQQREANKKESDPPNASSSSSTPPSLATPQSADDVDEDEDVQEQHSLEYNNRGNNCNNDNDLFSFERYVRKTAFYSANYFLLPYTFYFILHHQIQQRHDLEARDSNFSGYDESETVCAKQSDGLFVVFCEKQTKTAATPATSYVGAHHSNTHAESSYSSSADDIASDTRYIRIHDIERWATSLHEADDNYCKRYYCYSCYCYDDKLSLGRVHARHSGQS